MKSWFIKYELLELKSCFLILIELTMGTLIDRILRLLVGSTYGSKISY